ncbi:hypothetical protein TWF706_005048 [Orbilia oligospora]|nr:hypothetical protein TWF706_005048 [Orbilia oligospora]KAF3102921.1 hypothetical protein TWF706_005048 [Orbilia oligospora]
MSNSSASLGSAVCSIAADTSFGPVVQGCRNGFDFTFAFEQYFLSIVPSVVGLLLAVPRVRVLRARKPVVAKGGTLKGTKLVNIGLFACIQLILLILWSTFDQSSEIRTQAVTAASFSFVGAVVLSGLSYYEHHKAHRPSWVLTAYLTLTLLPDATILRTLYLSPTIFPLSTRVVSSVAFAAKIGIILLESMPKKSSDSTFGSNGRTAERFASPFSQLLYLWLNGLIKYGFKHVLKLEDLFQVDQEMEAERLDHSFWKLIDTSRGRSKLGVVLVSALKFPLLLAAIPRLILIVFIFCQPLLLETFLGYLKDPEERKNANIGKAIIGAYALVYVGMAITSAFYWYQNIRFITMLRGILMSAVYNKTTQLSIGATNTTDSVTLMSGDVENLVRGLREIHELWAAIVQIAIATWLLARQLGVACIGPLIVCFASAIIMGAASGRAKKNQLIWMEELQKRTGITSSIMGSLKGIKMLGLSKKLTDLVQKLRIDEVTASKKFRILAVYCSTLAYFPMMLSPVVTFAIYLGVVLRNNTTLDAQRMFTSLSLLMLITQPLFGVFQDIFEFMSSLGCLERIEAFLNKETKSDHRLLSLEATTRVADNQRSENDIELDQLAIQRVENLDGEETIVEVRDASFGWKKDDTPVINNINFSVDAGNLVMVCGPVASGKSTLLKSLLGETLGLKGFVQVATNSIGYCDQVPWLMGISIKDNITGFSRFNPTLYDEVLHACDLGPDISVFSDGDNTLVGSKGITLSGGQKQRVALARALYAQKKLIILDDVFSGLDMHTQSKVFDRVFGRQGLLRKSQSTVILATHSVNLLRHADKIIVLSSDGTILEQGSFSELVEAEGGYVKEASKLLDENAMKQPTEDQDTESSPQPSQPEKRSADTLEDPKRQSGDWSLYSYFFSRVGTKVTIAFIILEMLWAFFSAFPTLWLKWWSDANERAPNQQAGLYIGVYVVLQTAGLCSTALLTWCCINIMARKSGIEFHRILLNTVMRAPMAFISKTEVGSLVNRFTQDLGLIDRQLPIAIMCCVSNLFIVVAQAILISSASAYIAISFPALILAFYIIQRYYLRTSRQLRFLDLEAKAPVYTIFLESLEGLSTIRAFDWQSSFISKSYDLINTAQSPFYLLALLQKWLTLVLDLMTAALAVLVVGIAVATRETVSVGFTGVALTQIMGFTEYMKMFVLFWTQMETSLGAISRIRGFSEETPSEGTPEEENGVVPAGWPMAGEIEIQDATAGYDERMVLKEVGLSITSGEKFGICGRTGSGKSSLTLALLRMMELSTGSILLDGVDISTIPRETVRAEINVISQDPFFFSGTIKHNLDPYTAATDEEMISVLQKCQLGDIISGDKSIEDEFTPETLSHGQKQLFCLARALLRKSRIVVLDEATSGVDKDTDEMMQKVIREEMKEKTVIAIAHRLQTIMDFDRVAVMENGRVVEVGEPKALLKEDSKFKQLVDAM